MHTQVRGREDVVTDRDGWCSIGAEERGAAHAFAGARSKSSAGMDQALQLVEEGQVFARDAREH